MKTLPEQIAAVKRELAMRVNVYPRRVADKKMSQEKADHEIECMRSILELLEALEKHRQPTLL